MAVIVQHAVIQVFIVRGHTAARNRQARLNPCQHGALGVVGIDLFPVVIAGFIVVMEHQQVDFVPIAVAEGGVSIAPRGAGVAVVGAAGRLQTGRASPVCSSMA